MTNTPLDTPSTPKDKSTVIEIDMKMLLLLVIMITLGIITTLGVIPVLFPSIIK